MTIYEVQVKCSGIFFGDMECHIGKRQRQQYGALNMYLDVDLNTSDKIHGLPA